MGERQGRLVCATNGQIRRDVNPGGPFPPQIRAGVVETSHGSSKSKDCRVTSLQPFEFRPVGTSLSSVEGSPGRAKTCRRGMSARRNQTDLGRPLQTECNRLQSPDFPEWRWSGCSDAWPHPSSRRGRHTLA